MRGPSRRAAPSLPWQSRAYFHFLFSTFILSIDYFSGPDILRFRWVSVVRIRYTRYKRRDSLLSGTDCVCRVSSPDSCKIISLFSVNVYSSLLVFSSESLLYSFLEFVLTLITHPTGSVVLGSLPVSSDTWRRWMIRVSIPLLWNISCLLSR
jgi:hypothetical protein